MKDNLRDVIEITDREADGTYRLMYTTKVGDTIYVLDFLKKKSKSGTATPQADLDRIEARLKKVKERYAKS